MSSALKWFLTPAILAALLIAWQAYVQIFAVSPFILPAPLDVWAALVELLRDPKTYLHIWITLFETVTGFLIAVMVGVATGGVLGKGKVVWVENSFERKNKAVPAYLEDVGVVSVEDRYLGPMN